MARLILVALLLVAAPALRAQQFQNSLTYMVGGHPGAIAFGDFNRDGNGDLVLANYGKGLDAKVSVLLGNGDGTFAPYKNYRTAVGPYSIAIGDFNADGKQDLAVAAPTSGRVSVLLGNGDGTFQAHVDYATGAFPQSVAIGDFNADGKFDLVVSDRDSNTVGVFLGQGDGTFGIGTEYSTGNTPVSVAVGDFNRDHREDLVTADFSGHTVSVLLGNGDGTFAGHNEFAVGTAAISVAVADFSRDGNADIAVANDGDSTVSILLGNGNGTFQTHLDYATGSFPASIAAADLGRRGILDLVTANFGSGVNTVSVLQGNGDGTFRFPVDYSTGIGPISVAIGDLNGGDGALDIITADFYGHTASVLLNTGGTLITTASSNNPSHLNQPVTFTVSVAASLTGGSQPTGNVSLKDGVTFLGSASLISGVATFTTSTLSLGTHEIHVKYLGDSSFNPHKQRAIIQQVVP